MTELLPLAILADVTLGKMVQPSRKQANEEYRPYLRAAHIQANGRLDLSVEPKEMWFSPDEKRAYELLAGDVLLVEGGAVGRSAFLSQDLPGIGFQNALLRLRPISGTDGRYLDYCLQAAVASGEIDALCASVSIAHFTAEKVGRFRVPSSSPDRQRAIADYLDRETGEIDAMIAKMDELAETLNERKTAAVDYEISIDTSATRARLGIVADALTGLTYSPNDIVDSGGTIVHRSGSVQGSRIDRSNLLQVSTPIPEKLRFRQGDILVCSRNGSAHLVGKNAMVGPDEVGETWGAFMTVLRSPHSRYIYWYLQSSLFAQERSQFATSTINQLTIGMINRMELPFPSPEKQRRISDHLDEVTSKIDAMLAKVTELKSLLIERRAALITEVVTGRKKVA